MKIHLAFLTLILSALLSLATLRADEILNFKLLPQESRILTQIYHPFGTINGNFSLRDGEVAGDFKQIENTGRGRLTIRTGSYHSGNDLRDKNAKENYLETERYSSITFTSTEIDQLQYPSPYEWRFTVHGTLELHGVLRMIHVPIKLSLHGKKITVEGETHLVFREFGIPVPTILFTPASDAVKITFHLVAGPP